jgi:hypothetical protein
MSEADVYAGDLDLMGEGAAARETGKFIFRIHADCVPDVWPRVANQFLLANKVPDNAYLRQSLQDEVEIGVVLTGISPSVAAKISRKVSQQIIVTRVEVKRMEEVRGG